MTMLARDIQEAIHRELRWLMRSVFNANAGGTLDAPVNFMPTFNGEQARAMLRVEVSRAVEKDILEWLWRQGCLRPNPRENPPLKLEGVSFYVVDHKLPPCGWQVINPMAPDQSQRNAA